MAVATSLSVSVSRCVTLSFGETANYAPERSCVFLSAPCRSWKGTSVMYITSSYVSTSRGTTSTSSSCSSQDYIQEEQEFSTQMTASLERFARALGDSAALVRPFLGDIEATRQDVLSKAWPPRRSRTSREPPAC